MARKLTASFNVEHFSNRRRKVPTIVRSKNGKSLRIYTASELFEKEISEVLAQEIRKAIDSELLEAIEQQYLEEMGFGGLKHL